VDEYVPATRTDAILAEVLRNQHQLRFFDAIYIATAKNWQASPFKRLELSGVWMKTISFKIFWKDFYSTSIMHFPISSSKNSLLAEFDSAMA